MDKLMTVKEFIKVRYTDASAPHPRTIQNRLIEGKLPGLKDGGTWMVNISALEREEVRPVDDIDELVDLICSGETRSTRSVFA